MPTSLANAIGTTTRKEMEAAASSDTVGNLLLEDGGNFLLEDGGKLVFE